MDLFKWLRKEKKEKRLKDKKTETQKVEKELTEAQKQVEAKTQETDKEFEKYLADLIEEGKNRGLSEEKATKNAWRKIEKRLEKQRFKMGNPVICSVCKRHGVNKDTGGFVKNPDGQTYRHQNCR